MTASDSIHRFETSWVLKPWALFVCRALIGLYCLVTRVMEIVWPFCFPDKFRHGRLTIPESFSYFTTLANWGVTGYFLAATIHTYSYIQHHPHHLRRTYLARSEFFVSGSHTLLYTTICVFPLLDTLLYWTVLYDGTHGDSSSSSPHESVYTLWDIISVHLLIAFFALFEIIVPRTPMLPIVHLIALMVILWLYIVVVLMTYATQDWWVYSYLSLNEHGTGPVVGTLIMVFGILIVLFLAVRLAIKARLYFTEGTNGSENLNSTDAAQEELGIELVGRAAPKEQV